MLVKLCAYRIKIFQLGGWIFSHGYYLMIFHSRVSDCEAHILNKRAIGDGIGSHRLKRLRHN